jgi:hypothetical protein
LPTMVLEATLDAQTSSARGRCLDIHQPNDDRSTHQQLNDVLQDPLENPKRKVWWAQQ